MRFDAPIAASPTMDIRCPSCGTLYEFDPARIGSEGVNVRCSACGQVFKVRASAPDDASQWMVRRDATGEIIYFDDLSTLQRWIIEQKVSRTDRISKTGDAWKPLGSIQELATFFKVIDELNAPREELLRDTDGYLTAEERQVSPPPAPYEPARSTPETARPPHSAVLHSEPSTDRQLAPAATHNRDGNTPHSPRHVDPAPNAGPPVGGATLAMPGMGGPARPDAPSGLDKAKPAPILRATASGAFDALPPIAPDLERAFEDERPGRASANPPPPPKAGQRLRTTGAYSIGEEAEPAEPTLAYSLGEDDVPLLSEPRPSATPRESTSAMVAVVQERRGNGPLVIAGLLLLLLGVIFVFALRPDLLGIGAEEAPVAEAPEPRWGGNAVAPPRATQGERPSPEAGAEPQEGAAAAVATPPDSSDPAAISPAADGPPATDPAATDPAATDPAATDPVTGEPAANEPGSEAPAATPPEDDAAPEAQTAAPTPSAAPAQAPTLAPRAERQARAEPATRPASPPPTPAVPSDYDGQMAAAHRALDGGRHNDALDLFSAAAESRPNSAEAHVGVARAYDALGRHDLAAVRYQRATRVNSRYTPAWLGLGDARRRAGDAQGAIEAYERVLQIVRIGSSAERARTALEQLQP